MIMAARKTAAQKAAEAAEREAETTYPDHSAAEAAVARVEEAAGAEPGKIADENLTDVTDEKGKRLTVQQLKNKLRNEAERETLDNHRPEVIERTAEKYKAHNLEYVRRLTDQEKAQKDIEEKLDLYPELEAYIASRIAKHGEAQVKSEIREAVPGGPLQTFREANHEAGPVTYTRNEEGWPLRDVEAREGE